MKDADKVRFFEGLLAPIKLFPFSGCAEGERQVPAARKRGTEMDKKAVQTSANDSIR